MKQMASEKYNIHQPRLLSEPWFVLAREMLRAAQQLDISLNYDYSAILLGRKPHAGIPDHSHLDRS
jgi:hypothetical protein